MYSDVDCPYCRSGQEINHDDGYGYEEDCTFNQECRSCDKIFAYTTSISFHHEATKADCLNGGEHRWKETKTYPRRYTKLCCVDCDEEEEISPERRAELAAQDAA